ncbi:Tn3 family transposase [Streptomonospora salina]|uniref:TnpA family transposase n=1 Tax=Streptomonospora salina TaxID=104205 RepID=A0A841EKM9_9ACTN|nr:Tn3 family transposase [Streptomonospora salina]MBB6000890.1 TnpA family transposase [Streptomonospora salina]
MIEHLHRALKRRDVFARSGDRWGDPRARLLQTQPEIGITAAWGGGLIASAHGMRFVVPSQNLHTRANPTYFGLRKRGATWLNVINDQVMGLGGLVVPGTMRDSLYILDAIHARDGGQRPETEGLRPLREPDQSD